MTDVNYRDLASKWWVQAATPVLNKRARNKPIIDAILNVADLLGHQTDGLKDYLKQLSPRKAKSDAESVAVYDNSYKYANDRLTKMAPGRLLKRLFPTAPDTVVEGFTIWWKEKVAFQVQDYKLVVGNTRQDFKNAFTKYRRTSNLSYQGFRKSISDSCMRHQFERLACHPTEAYASGDFEVVTVKDGKGRTRARCVVRIKLLDGSDCYYPGRIYASDNHSAEMIEQYLADKGAILQGREDAWSGARLLKIVAIRSYFACPYVDNNRYVTGYDENHIVLCSYDGEYYKECNGQGGYVDIPDNERYNYSYKKPVANGRVWL